ncbi:hypothetical protein CEXT_812521 [Caerostris extrusa]|uniref:Uncharacterized protein n=1 Tax=Caerostris extrusa TaxID=172846 RepID=A0AAV4Q4N1_CAEEX|nr:hypothetical protein CEXT_812521 [Caerostris extrusa]
MTLDVQTGAAHMVFTAFSVTSERSRVIDYPSPSITRGVLPHLHSRKGGSSLCLSYLSARNSGLLSSSVST